MTRLHPKRRKRRQLRAFTLAEVMISVASSIIVIGALIAGSLELQRSLHASELYASSHADQRRLIDYAARDLRRAVAIAWEEDGMARPAAGETLSLSGQVALVLTLPGYYRNHTPGSADFDQPLAVVPTPQGVEYGTSAGPAPGIVVNFRKLFVATEGSVCFVREEAGHSQVIIRQAEALDLQVSVDAAGRSCQLVAFFASRFSQAGVQVATYDEIMLRNAPPGTP